MGNKEKKEKKKKTTTTSRSSSVVNVVRNLASKQEGIDRVLKVMEDDFLRAATAILYADYFLFSAGAGFSADSGLAVYKDIANVAAYRRMGVDYADLCTPNWIIRDPEIFFGFWGQCHNDYFSTEPHEGYKMVLEWRNHRAYVYQAACTQQQQLQQQLLSRPSTVRPVSTANGARRTELRPGRPRPVSAVVAPSTSSSSMRGNFASSRGLSSTTLASTTTTTAATTGATPAAAVATRPQGRWLQQTQPSSAGAAATTTTGGSTTSTALSSSVRGGRTGRKLDDTTTSLNSSRMRPGTATASRGEEVENNRLISNKSTLNSTRGVGAKADAEKNSDEKKKKKKKKDGEDNDDGSDADSQCSSASSSSSDAASCRGTMIDSELQQSLQNDSFSTFFVYTSNVDCAFVRMGFPATQVFEIHGNMQKWQCSRPCAKNKWCLEDGYRFVIDKSTMRCPCLTHISSNGTASDNSIHNTVTRPQTVAVGGSSFHPVRHALSLPPSLSSTDYSTPPPPLPPDYSSPSLSALCDNFVSANLGATPPAPSAPNHHYSGLLGNHLMSSGSNATPTTTTTTTRMPLSLPSGAFAPSYSSYGAPVPASVVLSQYQAQSQELQQLYLKNSQLQQQQQSSGEIPLGKMMMTTPTPPSYPSSNSSSSSNGEMSPRMNRRKIISVEVSTSDGSVRVLRENNPPEDRPLVVSNHNIMYLSSRNDNNNDSPKRATSAPVPGALWTELALRSATAAAAKAGVDLDFFNCIDNAMKQSSEDKFSRTSKSIIPSGSTNSSSNGSATTVLCPPPVTTTSSSSFASSTPLVAAILKPLASAIPPAPPSLLASSTVSSTISPSPPVTAPTTTVTANPQLPQPHPLPGGALGERMRTRRNHVFCKCGRLARPNILMFDDEAWVPTSGVNYKRWKKSVLNGTPESTGAMIPRGRFGGDQRRRLVIVEVGCGLRVPTVRKNDEKLLRRTAAQGGLLIRINPDFPDNASMRENTISVKSTGLEAVRGINAMINKLVETHKNKNDAYSHCY